MALSALLVVAPATANDWSGVYVGMNVGPGVLLANQPYANQLGYFNGTDGNAGNDDVLGGGFSAGAGIGANAQFGNLVFGIDADFNLTSLKAVGTDHTEDYDYYGIISDWDWYATIRAKAGVALDDVLIYATAGVAAVSANYNMCYYTDYCPDAPYDVLTNQTLYGLAAGAGAEIALAERVSLKGEVLYIAVPEVTTTTPGNILDGTDYEAKFTSSAVVARLGVNIHF